MSSIRLVMNVRNDADVLPRCINSVLPVISSWYIIDTSKDDDEKDNTREVIQEMLGHLPGQLGATPWVDHRTNRTALLKAAKMIKQGSPFADYALMMDSDMELIIDESSGRPTVPILSKDMYYIDLVDGSYIYPLPLLTAMDREWEYKGVAHSYLALVNSNVEGVAGATGGRTELAHWKLIDHGGSIPRPGKLENDLKNLQREVAEHPNDARSWYYLAQTYRDLEMWPEALRCYKYRISMGGWEEEVYSSMHNAGVIELKRFSVQNGLQMLFDAWKFRPTRAETLRAISEVSRVVADQIPYPIDDILFVRPDAYAKKPLPPPAVLPLLTEGPAFQKLEKRLVSRDNGDGPIELTYDDVSAVIVTRGNVDLMPIVESLPYKDIVIWDNSDPSLVTDYKIFGRYAALSLVQNTVVYWQDDDIIFTEHEQLLKEYVPGCLLSNMDEGWIEGAGYGDFLGMVGAGSLCDIDLPHAVFAEYFKHFPIDDDFLLECDFCFGTLAAFKRVDLGYEVRSFADASDRLYQQPWQQEKKWAMINRCRNLKNRMMAQAQPS